MDLTNTLQGIRFLDILFLPLILYRDLQIQVLDIHSIYICRYILLGILIMLTSISSAYIYVSWTSLFASVLCLLKWISVQPNTQNSSVPQNDGDIVKSMQTAKILVILTKFFLFSSVIFLILHFILS